MEHRIALPDGFNEALIKLNLPRRGRTDILKANYYTGDETPNWAWMTKMGLDIKKC